MGVQNLIDTVLRRFVIDKYGVLVKYKGKARHVKIPDKVTIIGTEAFAGNDLLESVIIPESVGMIEDRAFQRCSRLEKLQLPKYMRGIGKKAFEYCSSLQKVKIPSGCEAIGTAAFHGCSYLQQVTLPEGLVTIEADAFSGCTALTEIVFPATVKDIQTGAFQQCTALRCAILPKWLMGISDMLFAECRSLEQIILPDRITDIGTEAFRECSSLKKIIFSGKLTNIGQSAFLKCAALREVSFPKDLEHMGTNVFSHCTRLEKVVFREGPSVIRTAAFEGCEQLHDVRLPEKLECIEDNAFRGCVSLRELHVPESVSEFGDGCFTETPWLLEHPGDMVIAGAGVLLEYRGHARRLELPPHVSAVHANAFPAGHAPKTLIIPETARRLGWKFIPGLELVFRRKECSVSLILYDSYATSGQDERHILEFWEARNIFRRYRFFRSIHDPVYKFPLAVLMFLSEPEDEFYAEYVRRNAKDILKNLIVRNDTENLEKFLSYGFANADNIDSLIDFAIENTQKTGHAEPQIILIGYKSRTIGYSDIGDIIGNAFEL